MLSLSACPTDSQKEDGLSVHFLVRQLISLNLPRKEMGNIGRRTQNPGDETLYAVHRLPEASCCHKERKIPKRKARQRA